MPLPSIPIVVTVDGLQPRSPTEVLATLLANVAATNPGYTANLPGSLIEDISSTDVAAILQMDAAWVDLVNSVTPRGANAFMLNQLGVIYGVAKGVATNTSALVVFSGTLGFIVPRGFTVSDGTHQYTTQADAIIQTGGVTIPTLVVATQTGTWAVPAASITQKVTSTPSGITLTVSNPTSGTPATEDQTEEDYRADVIQAGLASGQAVPASIRTALRNNAGVTSRLVSVQQTTGGWEVIVGGGDPYANALAIWKNVLNLTSIVGSTLAVTAFTNANPGKVTTNLNHGYSNGQIVVIAGVSPGTFNGSYTIAVVDQKNFTVGVNTTGFGAYVSGGVVTPNLRNVTVTVIDSPNTYTVPFVVPPQQTVAIALTWNTTAVNFAQDVLFNSTANAALVAYINALPVGVPINVFEMQEAVQAATDSILDNALLTRMVFGVTINGVVTAPTAGTGVVAGDPESYFFTATASVSVVRG